MKKIKCRNEYNDVKSVGTEIVLSKEQFKEFYTFYNIIKTHFNDLCVVNGKFRSACNDKTFIVETAFSYFKGLNFNIADPNAFVKMLSTLDKNAAITFTIDDTNISFNDGFQIVKIMKANTEFIDNKFLTDEYKEQILDDYIDINNLFISETLPKSTVYNINKIARYLYLDVIKVKHIHNDLNRGCFHISDKFRPGYTSRINIREYTVKLKETFLKPMKKNHYFFASSLPFIFNRADMTLNYYLDQDESTLMMIYNTKVNGLQVYVLTRSAIHEDTEE